MKQENLPPVLILPEPEIMTDSLSDLKNLVLPATKAEISAEFLRLLAYQKIIFKYF